MFQLSEYYLCILNMRVESLPRLPSPPSLLKWVPWEKVKGKWRQLEWYWSCHQVFLLNIILRKNLYSFLYIRYARWYQHPLCNKSISWQRLTAPVRCWLLDFCMCLVWCSFISHSNLKSEQLYSNIDVDLFQMKILTVSIFLRTLIMLL